MINPDPPMTLATYRIVYTDGTRVVMVLLNLSRSSALDATGVTSLEVIATTKGTTLTVTITTIVRKYIVVKCPRHLIFTVSDSLLVKNVR